MFVSRFADKKDERKNYAMDLRGMIFGQDRDIQEAEIRRKLITILAIPPLIGVAWHCGIIASVDLALKSVAAVIWNMLRDVAAALGDFLQYVLNQRSH